MLEWSDQLQGFSTSAHRSSVEQTVSRSGGVQRCFRIGRTRRPGAP
jgi:hypothetical protein